MIVEIVAEGEREVHKCTFAHTQASPRSVDFSTQLAPLQF